VKFKTKVQGFLLTILYVSPTYLHFLCTFAEHNKNILLQEISTHYRSVPPMSYKSKFYLFRIVFGLLAGGLVTINSPAVRAEGSKEITANPAGYRPWFVSPAGGSNYFGVNQKLIVNVYANVGETINVGSSAIGNSVVLTAPDGQVYTYTTSAAAVANGIGTIDNSIQEQAGPLPNAGGYTPYTKTVGAGQSGIWQIRFNSSGSGVGSVLANNNSWTRAGNQGANALLAWDVTVRNGINTMPGRAYINNLGAAIGSFYPAVLKSTFYVLTKDGYIYNVNTNTLAPATFNFFSNNRGFTNAGNPSYLSFNGTTATFQDPYAADSGGNITNKMFLNPPDPNLPSSAFSAAGSNWLLNSPTTPIATNLVYTPNPAGGGTFTFSSNVTGSYALELDINRNGSYLDSVDRRIQGLANVGPNTVVWDGKDGNGVAISNILAYPVRISTRSGEIHFPVIDAESNISGFIISRTNGVNPGDSTIFWDDTSIPTGTASPGGTSSSLGAHIWGTLASSGAGAFGDEKSIDTWTFTRSSSNFLQSIEISGTVFNDIDNSANGTFNNIQTNTEIGVGLTSINAILVDNTNKVVASKPLASNGTYSFTDIAINQGNLRVLLSTASGVPGSPPPATSVPYRWLNTSPLTSGAIAVATSSIVQDFGLQRIPSNVLLVKRITAINGNSTVNPNDNTPLNQFKDDTVSPVSSYDNNPNWPITTPLPYLRGAIDAGKIKPSDEIEYTIYYLNAGATDTPQFKVCDRIAPGQTFKPNAYGVGKDLQIQLGTSTVVNMTSASDVVDRAQLYAPSATVPITCNLKNVNDNGTLAIDVAGTIGLPNLPLLPDSTAAGTPNNSYGLIRFTTIVNP
jgi:hypothetical protein